MSTIEVDGERFRDLDHDGQLAPYEDWRLSPEARTRDLVSRLTRDEKVGLVLHGTLAATGGPLGVIGIGPEYDLEAAEDLIHRRHVTSAISRLGLPPRAIAEQNNALQRIAAQSRLGIPVTISSDPRHHRAATTGAGVASDGFTQWPGPLGLAASRDPDVVRAFADVVRQEFRATGLHMALSPQADLGTSPQWSRIDGTFGDNPQLVRELVGAYVDGAQAGTSGLHAQSVITVVKHWVGYGAAPDGFDGHNYYGRYSEFPGGAFQQHVDAFRGAFKNNVGGVMPTYNILRDLVLNGRTIEQVGAGYSSELVNDLLRGEHGFDGLVLSDWAIAKDVNEACRTGQPAQTPADIAMAWGVENLTRAQRFAKGLNAGLDQFGGEDDPAPVIEAIETGLISEARLDESAYRVLIQKFELGLFEQPYVDVDAVSELVGDESSRALARVADRRSFVYLNKPRGQTNVTQSRLYIDGLDPARFEDRGLSVSHQIEDATLAIIQLATPHESLHPTFFFGGRMHEGDLDFKEDDPDFLHLREVAAQLPTIVVIEMDRPAIVTNIEPFAGTLIAAFGGGIEALLDLLTDPNLQGGALPLTLPASMAEVRSKAPDLPGVPTAT